MCFTQPMKQLLNKLKGMFPSKLPTGTADFDSWAVSIFTTYNLPDMPSYRNAIASMIMHLGPTTDKKPLLFFAKAVRKAQANQIAYEEIQKLKQAENDYIAATLAKPTETVDNGTNHVESIQQ